MPITLSCTACGRSLKLKDELAGRRIRCPGCQAALDVPEGSAAAVAKMPQESPEPRAGRRPAPPTTPAATATPPASGPESPGTAQPAAVRPRKSSGTRATSAHSAPQAAALPPRRASRAAAATGSRSSSAARRDAGASTSPWLRHWIWLAVLILQVQAFFLGRTGLLISGLVAGVGVLMTFVGGLLPMLLIMVRDPGTVLSMLFSRRARLAMMNEDDDNSYKQLVQGSFTKYRPLFWKGVLLIVAFIPAAFINQLGEEINRRAAVNDIPPPNLGPQSAPWRNPDGSRK